jgi:hypothetical protein
MRAVLQFERFHSRLYQKIAPACAKKMPMTINTAAVTRPPVLRVGDSYWAYPNTIPSDATTVPTTI